MPKERFLAFESLDEKTIAKIDSLQAENKKLQSDRTVKISFLETENKRLAAEVKQVKCASNNAVLKDLWNLKEELREANYQKNIWKTNCQKKVEENRELKAHEKSIYKYIEENKKLKEELKKSEQSEMVLHCANRQWSDLADEGIIMKKDLPVLLAEFLEQNWFSVGYDWTTDKGLKKECGKLAREFLKNKEAKKE